MHKLAQIPPKPEGDDATKETAIQTPWKYAKNKKSEARENEKRFVAATLWLFCGLSALYDSMILIYCQRLPQGFQYFRYYWFVECESTSYIWCGESWISRVFRVQAQISKVSPELRKASVVLWKARWIYLIFPHSKRFGPFQHFCSCRSLNHSSPGFLFVPFRWWSPQWCCVWYSRSENWKHPKLHNSYK